MSNDAATRHHQIVAVRIEFGTKYLNVGNALAPQFPQGIANKDVFDNSFAQ